jgi:hypothetical protein
VVQGSIGRDLRGPDACRYSKIGEDIVGGKSYESDG